MPAALILASFLSVWASTPVNARGEELAKWYQGPVRYLLTRREEKEFRSLPDDASRSEFVRLFWRRRDPVPETVENEARISFWRRVVEANRLFNDSALPGWKTDRGKIYILLGPPTDIQEDTNYNTRDPHVAATGLIRWLYEGVFHGSPLGASVVVPFVRGNDGSYHLSSSARFSSPNFDPLASYDRATADIARIQSGLDYGPSDLAVSLDQGLMQSPPWQEKDFIDRVTSEAYLGALPIQARFDFFRSNDGSSFAVITCAVPLSAFARQVVSGPPEVRAFARLAPQAGSGGEVDLGETEFHAAPTNALAGLRTGCRAPDGSVYHEASGDRPSSACRGSDPRASRVEMTSSDPLLYQARVALRPGRYDLYLGLFERARLQAANLRTMIEVPDFSGPLTISSLALGRALRPVPEGMGGWDRPFRVSDLELIPAVDSVFRTGGTFAALWQVYGESPEGPGSGLEVTSRFYFVSSEGERPLGKPRVVMDAQKVQGWSVDLVGWPVGDYRFEVRARDREGREAARSTGFRIE